MIEINDGNLTMPDHAGTYDEVGTPVWFLTGSAGSGKSYQLMKKIEEDHKYALLTSSTGISSMNIGAITVHSALKFGLDIEDAYIKGKLKRALRAVKDDGYRYLVIDEVSMIHKNILHWIYTALDELNAEDGGERPLGLGLTGDLLQLPPIPNEVRVDGKPVMVKGRPKKEATPWVFTAECWPKFEENTFKLTKIWRQSDRVFLDALNAARRGQGNVAIGLLKQAGVRFTRAVDMGFDGTTLIAKNDEVDRYNAVRLSKVDAESFWVDSSRWWAREWNSPSEWKNIPERLELKVGAYVMILANDTKQWSYVNGDCGWIRKVVKDGDGKVRSVGIELVRKPLTGDQRAWLATPPENAFYDDGLVYIAAIKRKVTTASPSPVEMESLARIFTPKEVFAQVDLVSGVEAVLDEYYWKRGKLDERADDDGWEVGAITYLPLRLAWASTVHKCLHPGTMVNTPRGTTSIGKLQIGDIILGYSRVEGRAVLTRVVGTARSTHGRVIIKCGTQGGIQCSPEHRFPTAAHDLELTEARDLKVGDEMLTIDWHGNRVLRAITELEYNPEPIEMVDIEVEHAEHLFLANGIVTSNSQGLTLDKVQIDTTAYFFGQPGLAYVALSRCRTPQGITLVGTESDIARKIKSDPAVGRFQ